jgi:copper chaperone CopZ
VPEEKIKLKINGMQCEHCRMSVEKAILAVPGVKKAAVQLAGGTAEVVYDPQAASPEAVARAVEKAGYGVER